MNLIFNIAYQSKLFWEKKPHQWFKKSWRVSDKGTFLVSGKNRKTMRMAETIQAEKNRNRPQRRLQSMVRKVWPTTKLHRLWPSTAMAWQVARVSNVQISAASTKAD